METNYEQQRKGVVIEEILVRISRLGKQDIFGVLSIKYSAQLLLFLLEESAIEKKMMACKRREHLYHNLL